MKIAFSKNKLIVISLCLFNFNLFSQASDGVKKRIAEIKIWYGEIQSIGLRNCTTKNYIEKDGYGRSFTQTVNSCRLNDIYSVKKGHFTGWEWTQEVSVYYRYNKIFFVLEKGSGISYLYEKRYYCDSDERIIQQLDRESNNEQILNGNNVEIRTNLYKSIRPIIEIERFK